MIFFPFLTKFSGPLLLACSPCSHARTAIGGMGIPVEMRTVLICKMVMLGSNPYISNIPEHYKRKFQDLIKRNIADRMNIDDKIKQIRILMNGERRILPLMIDYGREMNQHLVSMQSRN